MTEQMIILIGGPKHGEVLPIPRQVNFKSIDFRTGLDADELLYEIRKTEDDYFYGVYKSNVKIEDYD